MIGKRRQTSETHPKNARPNAHSFRTPSRKIAFVGRSKSSTSIVDSLDMHATSTETSSISINSFNDDTFGAGFEESGRSRQWKQVRQKVNSLWTDFLEGLAETNEEIAARKSEENERLNPNALKRDILRCLTETHVYLEAFAGMREFFIWRNPLASLCAFCVLIYCIYNEFVVTIFFGLILFQLGINYLETQKKISIGLRFIPNRKIPFPKFDFSGLQLVFEAARRAQILIRLCADCLEKLRALYMWKQPEVTLRFVFLISFFFWLSLLTSLNTYIIVVGFLTVNKMFVMTYMYRRFPLTRCMFDIAFYFYRHTLVELKQASVISAQQSNQVLPTSKTSVSMSLRKRGISFANVLNSGASTRRDSLPLMTLSAPEQAYSLSYRSNSSQRSSISSYPLSLPLDAQSVSTENSEPLVIEDQNEEPMVLLSRSCDLRDDSGVVSGILTLTDECLKFRSKAVKRWPPTLIEMPFATISRIKKVKTLNPLKRLKSRSSKGILLELQNDHQLQFVNISKCNEFYEAIAEMLHLLVVESRGSAETIE